MRNTRIVACKVNMRQFCDVATKNINVTLIYILGCKVLLCSDHI